MNVSGAIFANDKSRKEISRQEAELYSRLYAMAAEDFPSHPDFKTYTLSVNTCIEALQTQITELMSILASHTHVVPPHTHPIPPHTHISSAPGSPSGPNMGAFMTSPTTVTTNTPVQSASIRWNKVTLPKFKNTTNAKPNMEGNMVITGPTEVGPISVKKRRMKSPEILHTSVSIPPLLKL